MVESIENFGDRQQAETRYKKALSRLENCLARRIGVDTAQWREFQEIRGHEQICFVRKRVNEIVQQRQSTPQHRNILESIFTSLLPFSKTCLMVAVQGQPVLQLS